MSGAAGGIGGAGGTSGSAGTTGSGGASGGASGRGGASAGASGGASAGASGGGGADGAAGKGGSGGGAGASGSGGAGATGGAAAGGAGGKGGAGATGAAGISGSGGGAGTGGSAGAGGGAGSGGSAGTGGGADGTGGTVPGCTTSTPPTTSLIADFSASDGGAPVIAMGRVFDYGPPTPLHSAMDGSWHVTVDAPGAATTQYAGVGIYLDGVPATSCLDAHAYTGIRFKLAGQLSGCSLIYALTDSQHSPTSLTEDPRGSGEGGVYAPQAAIQPSAAWDVVSMPFSGLGAPVGGFPAVAVDSTKLTRLQWQITIPTGTTRCIADLRIDDIEFY